MYSIIIPTFNNRFIVHTLDSLIKSIKPYKVEILIIINKSAVSQLNRLNRYIKSGAQNISVIVTEDIPVPIKRNIGAIKAKYNNLIFIDDDCVVPVNFFSYLSQIENENFIRGGVLFRKSQGSFSKAYAELRKDWYSNPEAIYTPNLIISKDLLFKVGLFDEFAQGGEDVEWGVRAKQCNLKPRYFYNLLIEHTVENLNKKSFRAWLGYGRNKAYLIIKNILNKKYSLAFRQFKRINVFNNLKNKKSFTYNLVVLCVNLIQLLGFLLYFTPTYMRVRGRTPSNTYLKSKKYVEYCNHKVLNVYYV